MWWGWVGNIESRVDVFEHMCFLLRKPSQHVLRLLLHHSKASFFLWGGGPYGVSQQQSEHPCSLSQGSRRAYWVHVKVEVDGESALTDWQLLMWESYYIGMLLSAVHCCLHGNRRWNSNRTLIQHINIKMAIVIIIKALMFAKRCRIFDQVEQVVGVQQQ